MASVLDFHGFVRSGVYDRVVGPALSDGRLTGSVRLTLTDELAPGDVASEQVRFDVIGPGDVEDLRPGAVRASQPAPGTPDAEKEKCPYVELAAEDLPWRYSPTVAAGMRLTPWMVLVVAEAAEAQVLSGGLVTLTGDALATHDLGQAARWAHAQADPARPNQQRATRLLSPRPLKATTSYLAVLVPAFDASGVLSWGPATQSVTLRALHRFEFTTAETGDFPALAGRLRPAPGGDLGRAPLTYAPLGFEGLLVRGALAPVGAVDLPVPPEVASDVGVLTTPPVVPRRPVVTLPDYGDAWVPVPADTTWGETFHADPRHRGVAGLGLHVGIAEQELLSDAAAAQAGALDAAAQRIRHLVAGLAAARSVWSRRLPLDPVRRLAVFGPALRRMMTSTGSVRDRITAPGSPLPAALFSTAARRVLRPGTVRGRGLARGAADPAAVLTAANECPRPPDRAVPGLPHTDLLADATGTRPLDEEIREALRDGRASFPTLRARAEAFDRTGYSRSTMGLFDEVMRRWIDIAEQGGEVPVGALLAVLDPPGPRPDDGELRRLLRPLFNDRPDDGLLELGTTVLTGEPDRQCRPVRLEAVCTAVADAVDPTVDRPFVLDCVLELIDGLDDQPLTPPELCPDLDLPAWQMVRDHDPDWLLPGAATMPEDRVVAMSTNPEFIDAFLLGLNTQTLGELRFRNIPVQSGCTPLRQFWARADVASDRYADDIVGVHSWAADSPLGSVQHQTPQAASADLVVVFRTPLFRRYPRTLVYLTPAPLSGGVPDWEAEPDLARRLEPTFQGTITPDITFFGFDLEPDLGAVHWVVLEEPPRGVQFFNTEPVASGWDATRRADFLATGADGGTFAAAAFAEPFRVMLRGEALL